MTMRYFSSQKEKMSAKYTLFLLFGFYLQTVIYTLVISEEERREWGNFVQNTYYNDCRHHMSEESESLIQDDFSTDNEETRLFKLCLLEHLEYLKDDKIDTDLIISDGRRFVKNGAAIIELGAKVLLGICKTEAENNKNKLEISAKFLECIDDRIQTDL